MNPLFHGSKQLHINKILTSSGNDKNSQETLANSEISLISNDCFSFSVVKFLPGLQKKY